MGRTHQKVFQSEMSIYVTWRQVLPSFIP